MSQAEVAPGSIPKIGEPAPDFQAITTQGPLKFSDLKGNWVVLFSHPADFTPVCTEKYEEFSKRGVKVVGLSIDSIHAHLAWMQNIQEKMGIKIPFPVIADLDMKVASKYGMIHPGASSTATVRAVFIIDPNGVVRALVYYPLNSGRNIEEILRLIDSLQTVDKHGVATPANWKPGDKVIIPPPKNEAEVEERLKSNYEKVDFYLMKKSPLAMPPGRRLRGLVVRRRIC